MRPPDSFTADLLLHDPELRCRWSRHRAAFGQPLWIIERKEAEGSPLRLAQLKALDLSRVRLRRVCAHSEHVPTCRQCRKAQGRARTVDLWEGARDGYAHVMDVHPSLLSWSQVGRALAAADMWRHGGAQRYADRLDAQDEAADRAQERHEASVLSDHTYGLWDDIKWRNRERVNVPVEVKDGFTVTDRRTVSV